ncbi:MAG TPA: hypothetical protein PLP14_07510 [Chitinophagaceae bacterium]|nr:hypothetical protein [Chitinophagaceae bacterium]
MRSLLGCLLIFLLAVPASSNAQDSVTYHRPRVILFMLHISSNKIEALRKRGLEKDIPSILAQDEEINLSVMKDMAANFHYCPVYFFYDTCYEKAVQKQWQDIVFYDYESLVKKKKLGTNSFSDYYFAEVGYRSPDEQLPVDSTHSRMTQDILRGDEGHAATRNYGINMYDEDFKPIHRKFGFVDISLLKQGPLLGKRYYVFTGAAKFEKTLIKRFGP